MMMIDDIKAKLAKASIEKLHDKWLDLGFDYLAMVVRDGHKAFHSPEANEIFELQAIIQGELDRRSAS